MENTKINSQESNISLDIFKQREDKPQPHVFLGGFRAYYRNARAVIAQIKRDEWEFMYNPLMGRYATATRNGEELWVCNGSFFCDLRYKEPAFGLIFRHWVWYAAVRKKCQIKKILNIPDLTI